MSRLGIKGYMAYMDYTMEKGVEDCLSAGMRLCYSNGDDHCSRCHGPWNMSRVWAAPRTSNSPKETKAELSHLKTTHSPKCPTAPQLKTPTPSTLNFKTTLQGLGLGRRKTPDTCKATGLNTSESNASTTLRSHGLTPSSGSLGFQAFGFSIFKG